MHEESRVPIESGSPSAAARESRSTFNVQAIKRGERIRNSGLRLAMPERFGGGTMQLIPASSQRVQVPLEDHKRKVRNVPQVKRVFKRSDELTGKPMTEVNRFMVVMCIVGWEPDALPADDSGEVVFNPADADLGALRTWIKDTFLPELDLTNDTPPEDELNNPFLVHLLEGLAGVSEANAEEIAEVGKGFTLGQNLLPDYNG